MLSYKTHLSPESKAQLDFDAGLEFEQTGFLGVICVRDKMRTNFWWLVCFVLQDKKNKIKKISEPNLLCCFGFPVSVILSLMW